MKAGSRHVDLLLSLLAQAVLLFIVLALFTLAVAAGYGALASFWQGQAMGISAFEPSVYAWEAAVLLAAALALFNATGASVELDCDMGLQRHSVVTYGFALATTTLVALVLERMSHGTWLQPYVRSWLGPTAVAAFLTIKLVAMRWHRKSLLSQSTQ